MKLALVLITLFSFIHVHSTYHLYAPWRNQPGSTSTKQCPFCTEIKAKKDDQYLILYRSSTIIVQLNPRPYTPGSILIYPLEHVSDPQKLSPLVWCDMFLTAQYTMAVLTSYIGTDSFSLGMNIGALAHGSIPGHLHLHVIPRNKEANGFLETACETRLIQKDLGKMYDEMKEQYVSIR